MLTWIRWVLLGDRCQERLERIYRGDRLVEKRCVKREGHRGNHWLLWTR